LSDDYALGQKSDRGIESGSPRSLSYVVVFEVFTCVTFDAVSPSQNYTIYLAQVSLQEAGILNASIIVEAAS
jgi:hypothetical protein